MSIIQIITNAYGLNVFQYPISKLLIGCAADLSYGYTGYNDIVAYSII